MDVTPLQPAQVTFLQAFTSNPPETKPPLIDVRPAHLFAESHIEHATNFPGMSALASRAHELPAPSASPTIGVIADSDTEARFGVQILGTRGYPACVWIPAEIRLASTAGSASRAVWSPAPLVAQYAPVLAQSVPARTALDIGCGSGRDAAYLSMMGFRVTAVDRDAALLRKAEALAKAPYYIPGVERVDGGTVVGVERTLGTHLADDTIFLRAHATYLLVVVRFLRRGVLETLHEGVLPGGFVMYEHFLTGCERFGGPVKRAQMLERGELATVFNAERGFTVICDEEHTLADGRPVVRFVAQREAFRDPLRIG